MLNNEVVVIYFQLAGYITVSALNSNWNIDHRLYVDGNNHGDNRNGYAFEIALVPKSLKMKTYNNLYSQITSEENLILAYKKARKGKTKKEYVRKFSKNLKDNILNSSVEINRYLKCLRGFTDR